jgi:hypothetical protein
MFALRQWAGGFHPPITALTPEDLPVGDLPAAALPIIAALLGGFFELDNTGAGPEDAKKKGESSGAKKRVAGEEKTNGQSKSRVREDDDEGEAEQAAAAAAPKRAKR